MLANLARKIVPAQWRPIGYLTHLVQTETNCCVQDGPFTGMKYIDDSAGSAYIPKLLGIYEQELNSYIEKACTLDIKCIVNIGAGEGYYTVGMAMRNPLASIIAFEMEAKGRDAIAQLAEYNSVQERIKIYSKCEPEHLELLLPKSSRTLIICDVEGYELTLLNPHRVPALKDTFILVELHDFITKGLAEEISSRFAATHNIERIWQTERTRQNFPFSTFYTRCLPSSYIDWTVSEWRPERMSWYWMEPRSYTGQSHDTP